MTGSRLRIMVVLPMYGGSLPIGRYCARALADLGHSVRVFDAPLFYPAFTGMRKLDLSQTRMGYVENSFLRLVSQSAWIMAQEQAPQIVLALAQAPLDRETLERMRGAGIRTIMWFVEDYKVFDYWRAYAPLYDAFAIIQKHPFLDELKKIGQEHAFYLPLAALPDFHRPLALMDAEKVEYGSDISFLGAGYPNRRLAFRPLADRDFKIWGSDWEGEKLLARNIQRNGSRISEDESLKIYNASKINLNLHSSIDASKLVSGGDFVNPRTFELAAMGAFQLVDKRSLMPELFAEDELAVFENVDDFYKAIDYFLAHPEERQAYARKAMQRVRDEHTYQRRMQALIDYMIANFGPFANAGTEESPLAELPGEIRAKISGLLQKLGLPPETGFTDLVARLRRQTGTLDEVETAILFLDEWRSQYRK